MTRSKIMSIFAVQVWIPGQFFKVIRARSYWFEASFLWRGVVHHNEQFQFMMGIIPFGRRKPLSARQQWVPSRPDFTSTCPEFILDPGGRPVHPQWAHHGQGKQCWPLRCWPEIETLCRCYISPSVHQLPLESHMNCLPLKRPSLSIWGRRITKVY